LVEEAEAEWVGVATVVDEVETGTRRRLNARVLLRAAELPD